MAQWNSDRSRTILDIRPGGPGNAWLLFSTQGKLAAPSGGGQSVDSRWGRGARSGSEPKGTIVTSNPERWTFDLMDRLDPAQAKFLQNLYGCPFDVRVRQLCGDFLTRTNYDAIIEYVDAWTTSRTYSTNLANNADTPGDDTMETGSMSAITEYRMKKLAHLSLTKTNVDAAVNKIINVGVPSCAGDCGTQKTGEEEFWCVTDRDSTPGYLSQPTAFFGYTTDNGNTWMYSYIDVFQNADATDVIKAGDYAIVVSPTGGIAYARFQDIVDGVPSPWTLALGGIGSNGPNVLASIPSGNAIYAAGQNGYIYRSIDGGFTWTTFDAGVTTTQHILSIATADDNLIWFGAANGVLLKFSNGSVGVVSSGVAANINTVAVAAARDNELYFGTAAGRLYRSKNARASTPTFTELALDGAGSGSVDDIQFAGYRGDVMFVVQSNAAGKSRVLRDLSGGAMGSDAEIIASYNSPDQNGINSIAPANSNFALCVGELVGGYGYYGKVASV